MPAVSSTLTAIGTQAPDFALLEPATNATVTRAQFAKQAMVVAFICNHCPYVIHIRDALNELARFCQKSDIAVVGINANDPINYPDDSPENMIKEVNNHGLVYHYLFDATQDIARAYGATCTPDIYLFDSNHGLWYRGQFDATRPGKGTATGADLYHAIDTLLTNAQPPKPQHPSMGCSIKWRV